MFWIAINKFWLVRSPFLSEMANLFKFGCFPVIESALSPLKFTKFQGHSSVLLKAKFVDVL